MILSDIVLAFVPSDFLEVVEQRVQTDHEATRSSNQFPEALGLVRIKLSKFHRIHILSIKPSVYSAD